MDYVREEKEAGFQTAPYDGRDGEILPLGYTGDGEEKGNGIGGKNGKGNGKREEGKEAEAVGRGLVRGKRGEGGGGMDSLAAMIQQRQKERAAPGGLFEGLEAKYAPPSKKSARKKKRP